MNPRAMELWPGPVNGARRLYARRKDAFIIKKIENSMLFARLLLTRERIIACAFWSVSIVREATETSVISLWH